MEGVTVQDSGAYMLRPTSSPFSEGDLQKDQTESEENPEEGERGGNAG